MQILLSSKYLGTLSISIKIQWSLYAFPAFIHILYDFVRTAFIFPFTHMFFYHILRLIPMGNFTGHNRSRKACSQTQFYIITQRFQHFPIRIGYFQCIIHTILFLAIRFLFIRQDKTKVTD